MTKQETRQMMRGLEAGFQSCRADDECAEFWQRVEDNPGFRNARTILLYMSVKGEIPTGEFISKWHGVKRIAIPVVCKDMLEIREYDPLKIREGYRGITEPTEDAPAVKPEEIDFAVIPGVAFARAGENTFKRLGRGKGFYDRLLPMLECPCIPAGWSFRFLDDIPTDPWDAVIHTGPASGKR